MTSSSTPSRVVSKCHAVRYLCQQVPSVAISLILIMGHAIAPLSSTSRNACQTGRDLCIMLQVPSVAIFRVENAQHVQERLPIVAIFRVDLEHGERHRAVVQHVQECPPKRSRPSSTPSHGVSKCQGVRYPCQQVPSVAISLSANTKRCDIPHLEHEAGHRAVVQHVQKRLPHLQSNRIKTTVGICIGPYGGPTGGRFIMSEVSLHLRLRWAVVAYGSFCPARPETLAPNAPLSLEGKERCLCVCVHTYIHIYTYIYIYVYIYIYI